MYLRSNYDFIPKQLSVEIAAVMTKKVEMAKLPGVPEQLNPSKWLKALKLNKQQMATTERPQKVEPQGIKVEVFKDCRRYLDAINLCNNGIYFKSFKVPDILYDIILVTPMTYTTVLLLYFCFANHFDLSIVAFAFSICIGCTQITLVYFALAFEKRVIFETMAMIQNLVDYRKRIKFD